MANGDYWNRGGRQQGVRTNTAMDTLERVLGMGRGIAQGVQANRKRRDDYDLKMIGLLAGNYQTEYNSDVLNKSIEDVEKYRNKKMNNMSENALEAYDVILNQMKNQQEQNINFKTDMSVLGSLSKDAGNWATDLYENWELKTPEEQDALIASGAKDTFGIPYSKNYSEAKKKDFLKISEKWAEAKGKMSQYDSRRMTGFHTSEIANLEMIVNGALKFYGDGQMSELELNTIQNAVASGNAKPIQDLMGTQARQESNVTTSLFNELEKMKKGIENAKQILKNGKHTVQWKDVKNLINIENMNLEQKASFQINEDDDNYTINLDDGSQIANQYKMMLQTELIKLQDEMASKIPAYESITGTNYAKMYNLSDDFLGDSITTDDKISSSQTLEEKDLNFLPNQDKNLLNKKSVLEKVDPVKANNYKLPERLDKLKNMDTFFKNYKYGDESLSPDTETRGGAPGGKGALSPDEQQKIKNWYKKNYPKQKISLDKQLNSINSSFKSILGDDDKGNLSYEKLKQIEKIHADDKLLYENALKEIKKLQSIGQVPKDINQYLSGKKVLYGPKAGERQNLEPWQRHILEIDDYGQKWLNWKTETTTFGTKSYMNRDKGLTITGTAKFKLSPTGKSFDQKQVLELNRNTLEELKKQLELYESIFPEIFETNQERINTILKNV
tara:strand:+ start:2599 stop:4614 length:2016 start_codon:yes stop_codon:yes gene_type:complete